MNTDEGIKIIINDEDLATAFRLLLMNSLQRKVTALCKSQHEKEQNKVEDNHSLVEVGLKKRLIVL